MLQQADTLDSKSVAQAQQESAEATLKNIQAEQALTKQPNIAIAKLFRTCQPNESMQMLTPTGRSIIFQAGKCITKRPEEIAYLQAEIDDGNPRLQPVVEDVFDEESKAVWEQRIREEAVADYIARVNGATSSAGTSDNTGAGTMATTVNASVGAAQAPQSALDRLKAQVAAAKATPAPEQAPAPEANQYTLSEVKVDATAEAAGTGASTPPAQL